LRAVVGLGNPGPEFALTRHNIGFWVVDLLGERDPWEVRRFVWGEVRRSRERLLLKPLTYMNNSGEALGEFLRIYPLEPRDILVVYDDVDIPVGEVRLRARGGDGGHKGMRSVIAALGTQDIPRLRVGIGPCPEGVDMVEFVLSRPPEEELQRLRRAASFAAEVAWAFLEGGYPGALRAYSRGISAARVV